MVYRGDFNYHGEEKTLYTQHVNERGAWANLCTQMAYTYKVHPSVMLRYFDGSKDNYKITEVK